MLSLFLITSSLLIQLIIGLSSAGPLSFSEGSYSAPFDEPTESRSSSLFESPLELSSMNDDSSVSKASAKPMTVSKAQYESLFAQPALDNAGPESNVVVGSMRVSWGSFNDFFPHLKLIVTLPTVPGFQELVGSNEFQRFSSLRIEHVFNKQGVDVLDADSPFEKGSFVHLDFLPTKYFPNFMEAERTVHLIDDVKEADIQSVEGVVTLDLPTDIKPLRFSTNLPNATQTHGTATVIFKSLESDTVVISYQGESAQFIKVVGYDAAGKELDLASKTGYIPDARTEPLDITTSFEGIPSVVDVYVGGEVLYKSFPFKLTHTNS